MPGPRPADEPPTVVTFGGANGVEAGGLPAELGAVPTLLVGEAAEAGGLGIGAPEPGALETGAVLAGALDAAVPARGLELGALLVGAPVEPAVALPVAPQAASAAAPSRTAAAASTPATHRRIQFI